MPGNTRGSQAVEKITRSVKRGHLGYWFSGKTGLTGASDLELCVAENWKNGFLPQRSQRNAQE
jgi:hypothetical protein